MALEIKFVYETLVSFFLQIIVLAPSLFNVGLSLIKYNSSLGFVFSTFSFTNLKFY